MSWRKVTKGVTRGVALLCMCVGVLIRVIFIISCLFNFYILSLSILLQYNYNTLLFPADTIDKWDEHKLKEVVEKKQSTKIKQKTDIVRKTIVLTGIFRGYKCLWFSLAQYVPRSICS